MSKYFGTDGFRGEANCDLTATHAFKIGRILGKLALDSNADCDGKPAIVIGKDTRHSGDMFESALAAGITSSGADAYILGVVTTPGVAYITRTGAFVYGIMISASHNPFWDNGIKVLNAQGEKLDDETIDTIEAYIDGAIDVVDAKREGIGRVIDHRGACETYADYLVSLCKKPFTGYRIALDCANGSASYLAEEVYTRLGAEVVVCAHEPNGLNINVDCGSTHIGNLAAFVVAEHADLGFAYDGDADRCLAVDASGNLVDGDQIMYLSALHMRGEGRLANNTVVTTIMSNFGLYKALDEAVISYEKTKVGDKYVYENMAQNGHAIGGEQSGHIIFREFATTGDGVMTSLMVMEAVIASGKSLAELVAGMTVYPQVLKNVRVKDKAATLDDADVKSAIQAAGDALGDTGRVLVRQSGTEPVIRVMAEAPTEESCEIHVDAIIDVMKQRGYVIG